MKRQNKEQKTVIEKKDIDILIAGCIRPYSTATYKYQVCTRCPHNSPDWNCLFEIENYIKELRGLPMTDEAKKKLENYREKLKSRGIPTKRKLTLLKNLGKGD